MQQKHVMIIIVLCVIATTTTALFYVSVAGRDFSTYICTESVTLNPQENKLIEFYMPEGSATGIKLDFVISDGTVKYAAEPSSHFEDSEELLQFLAEYPVMLQDVDSGPAGFGWSGADYEASTPVDVSYEYVDQIWYLYLSNGDSFSKDVTVDVSKTWKFW